MHSTTRDLIRAIDAAQRAFIHSWRSDRLEAHAEKIDGLQHVEMVPLTPRVIDLMTRRMAIERERARVGGGGEL